MARIRGIGAAAPTSGPCATLPAVRSLRTDIGLAMATSTAIGFTYAAHAPLLTLISAEFALSDVQAGLIATALFLAAAATMVVVGDIADRSSPRDANTWGLALAVVGNGASAIAPSYELLLLAKAVGGVGAGIALLSGLGYLGRRYAGERSHFGQGLYGAGFPLGSAIALWLLPSIALGSGWRGAFALSTVGMLIVLVAWLRASPVERAPVQGTMVDALRCPNCWWTALQHAAGFGLTLAAGTWITVYLLREFGLPLDASGLLGSLLLVLAVVARPVGGYLVAREHVGSLSVMRAAQLLIVAGLALLALPDRPLAVAVIGAMAVGLGGGMPYAVVFNTAAASLRQAPGAAQGLTALGGLASTLVGAPAMGYAIQTWGFSSAWLILGLLSIAALAVTFVMRGEEQL